MVAIIETICGSSGRNGKVGTVGHGPMDSARFEIVESVGHQTGQRHRGAVAPEFAIDIIHLSNLSIKPRSRCNMFR